VFVAMVGGDGGVEKTLSKEILRGTKEEHRKKLRGFKSIKR
jgi:hypothetical protein